MLVTESMLSKCKLVAALIGMLCLPQAYAYKIDGSKWPGGETDFFVALDGTSGTGFSWQSAFVSAMDEWNDNTGFKFILRKEYRDPCVSDAVNGVDFTDTVCGSDYGANTLAVTIRSWQTELLGPPKIVRGDIVINNKKALDIYDGNLFQPGILFAGIDFRRIALHELGHVIGLDHDDTKAAIMRSSIGNTYKLQLDDVQGVNTLYGGLASCDIKTLTFGVTGDSLGSGDCTVQALTVGGSDDSYIDVRRLDLDRTTTVDIRMLSSTLDSVLLLADSQLRFISLDDNGAGACNARLKATLAAGTYYILSNTYDSPTTCGNNQGSYELQASFVVPVESVLGPVVSILGSSATIQFTGGITADNGKTFGNLFHLDDSLDIYTTIVTDPAHLGQSGFIIIAVLINGEIYLMDDTGQLQPYPGEGSPIVHAANRALAAVERVDIATDLVPAELGIQSIRADFLVGYGLDSNPNEIYYHQAPLNLIIGP